MKRNMRVLKSMIRSVLNPRKNRRRVTLPRQQLLVEVVRCYQKQIYSSYYQMPIEYANDSSRPPNDDCARDCVKVLIGRLSSTHPTRKCSKPCSMQSERSDLSLQNMQPAA